MMQSGIDRAFAAWARGAVVAVTLGVGALACGSSGQEHGFGSAGSPGGGQGNLIGSGGTKSVPCPAGMTCNVSCGAEPTTSISGVVYDPAGRNPLYNVSVYVPATPLKALPRGVPTGAAACNCSALFESGAVASATTGVDGSFTIRNAPVGSQIPLVIQVGKWRRQVTIDVTQCQDNPQPSGSLLMPGSVPAGDEITSMPEIAVSTGGADSLECLMSRIGLPPSEYVPGAGGAGHVHVFTGAATSGSSGWQENPSMPGAPESHQALWASKAQLMPFDVVLLSCEGGETYDANPSAMQEYLDAGGRVFASHYHYAWFAGPLITHQHYSPPSEWGGNLATWGEAPTPSGTPIATSIEDHLNGSSTYFPKGRALQEWLGDVHALGQDGVPADQLPIYQPRFNAQVGSQNKASQTWITSGSHALYFSFNTPVNAPKGPSGQPQYCGRAVYSDLHVGGSPQTKDGPPPPTGCYSGDLSPQEKALEFMLFDLSSCVVPDTVTPGGVFQ